jgi:hypothetical protein
VPRLILKINGESGKHRIHGLDSSKTPTSVHAEAAVCQLHQWFDMVPLQFPSRRHLLEFFSHKIAYRSRPPSDLSLLRIVSTQKPRINPAFWTLDILVHPNAAREFSRPQPAFYPRNPELIK